MNKPMTREENKSYIVKEWDDLLAHKYFNEIYGYREGQELDRQDKLIEIARMDAFIEGQKYQQKPNTGCDNCHKLYFELTAKIKELKEQVGLYEILCDGQDTTVTQQKSCIFELNAKIKELEKETEQRCLKNTLLEMSKKGDANTIKYLKSKIKKLESELKSLKPQKKVSSRCPKCKQIVYVHDLDLLTGCCEGGCKLPTGR